MRILLTANASYDPPRGGATRSNLVWLRHLASAGHECRTVCGGDQLRRVPALREQILEWRPDWVLVSSEDLGHALLREAHHSAPGRVVYLAHTPQFYPFGPASWNPDHHPQLFCPGRWRRRSTPVHDFSFPPAHRLSLEHCV